MNKKKLIGLLVGTISITAIISSTTIALTSCNSSGSYNPDKSTRVIDVVPDLNMFNNINNSYQTYIKGLNTDHKPGWKTTGSFSVNGNKISIIQTEIRGSGSKPIDFILEFSFDTSDNVSLTSIQGQNHEVVNNYKLTVEKAKERIYGECHYKPIRN